jgi:hypothetical protein
MSTSQRSRWVPGASSAQRTTSHITMAMESSETVYTFSLTVDWFHTVQQVAPTSTPPSAAPYRAHR